MPETIKLICCDDCPFKKPGSSGEERPCATKIDANERTCVGNIKKTYDPSIIGKLGLGTNGKYVEVYNGSSKVASVINGQMTKL